MRTGATARDIREEGGGCGGEEKEGEREWMSKQKSREGRGERERGERRGDRGEGRGERGEGEEMTKGEGRSGEKEGG